jgi:peptidyl-tRNA hydrolase
VNDPWVMYYVVRKDMPLSRDRAMVLAGAGAVRCADRLRNVARWAEPFARWQQRPRKVALRASAEELEAIRAQGDHVELDGVGICLPPCRRSDRAPVLGELRAYTDGPRPKAAEPSPEGPAMTYVVRPGVLRTAGKAMAQAGHAALMCADQLGPRHPEAFRAWREAGLPGLVEEAGQERWDELRPHGVVVTDAGLTQVAPGTETVLALPPLMR